MSTVTTVGTCDFVWDFSVDGGAIGAIDLSAKAGKEKLWDKALITKVHALVLTAPTSAGSSNVKWGTTNNPDGYSGTAYAHSALTLDKVVNGQGNGTNCVWDDTSKTEISCYLTAEDDRDFVLTISDAALTAGKIQFLIEFVIPAGLDR